MELELFDPSDAARMEEALAIRLEVFVAEQGVPLELEIDEYDRPGAPALHVLVREAGRAVGTGRFYDLPSGHVQIGRMAVRPEYRHAGVGRRILDALIAEARRRGVAEAHLHAQTHAAAFYRKAGFEEYGAPFDDAGIPHVAMFARL